MQATSLEAISFHSLIRFSRISSHVSKWSQTRLLVSGHMKLPRSCLACSSKNGHPREEARGEANLYPPRDITAYVAAARQTALPASKVNPRRHFSAHNFLFTCASVSSASPQRTIEK